MTDGPVTLETYRAWVKAGAPSSDPHQRELLRVAALASVVRSCALLDDQSMAIAHIAILRRAWVRRAPQPPPNLGCSEALTMDGKRVVLVVPCVDGDVYVHMARRGHRLISVLMRMDLHDLQGALAITKGMAARILAELELIGWPEHSEFFAARDKVNEILRTIRDIRSPNRPRS